MEKTNQTWRKNFSYVWHCPWEQTRLSFSFDRKHNFLQVLTNLVRLGIKITSYQNFVGSHSVGIIVPRTLSILTSKNDFKRNGGYASNFNIYDGSGKIIVRVRKDKALFIATR